MNLTLNFKHDSLKCGTQEKIWTLVCISISHTHGNRLCSLLTYSCSSLDTGPSSALLDILLLTQALAQPYTGPCWTQMALAQPCWIGQPCWTYSCSSLDTGPSSSLLDILLLTQALAQPYTGPCWTQTALAQPC